MSLTQYYTATSLDGFIADPANSLDWLFTRQREPDGPLNYGEFIAGVGAMAMGSTTYEWILEHDLADKDPAESTWPYDIRSCRGRQRAHHRLSLRARPRHADVDHGGDRTGRGGGRAGAERSGARASRQGGHARHRQDGNLDRGQARSDRRRDHAGLCVRRGLAACGLARSGQRASARGRDPARRRSAWAMTDASTIAKPSHCDPVNVASRATTPTSAAVSGKASSARVAREAGVRPSAR